MTNADRVHSRPTVKPVFTIASKQAAERAHSPQIRAPNLPYWGGFSSLLIQRKASESIGSAGACAS
jgi:hypothetical protein